MRSGPGLRHLPPPKSRRSSDTSANHRARTRRDRLGQAAQLQVRCCTLLNAGARRHSACEVRGAQPGRKLRRFWRECPDSAVCGRAGTPRHHRDRRLGEPAQWTTHTLDTRMLISSFILWDTRPRLPPSGPRAPSSPRAPGPSGSRGRARGQVQAQTRREHLSRRLFGLLHTLLGTHRLPPECPGKPAGPTIARDVFRPRFVGEASNTTSNKQIRRQEGRNALPACQVGADARAVRGGGGTGT